MAEEQIIRLLEEIRDLQKLHLENFKDALKSQQESIEIQKLAVRRQKITVISLLILLVGWMVFWTWPLFLGKG